MRIAVIPVAGRLARDLRRDEQVGKRKPVRLARVVPAVEVDRGLDVELVDLPDDVGSAGAAAEARTGVLAVVSPYLGGNPGDDLGHPLLHVHGVESWRRAGG